MPDLKDYTDAEWGLLVGLPQSVIVAAASAEHDGGRRTAAEAKAGMTAIADARDCGSELVERVAGEIIERVGDPEEGETPPLTEFPDRAAGIDEVLVRCAEAVRLLAAKAEPHEAQAYLHWVREIAEQVVQAAASGDFLGLGGEQVSEGEQEFIGRLQEVLGD